MKIGTLTRRASEGTGWRTALRDPGRSSSRSRFGLVWMHILSFASTSPHNSATRRQRQYPRLYSLQGFRYCDLLLSDAERAAWRATLASSLDPKPAGDGVSANDDAHASGLRLNDLRLNWGRS